MSNFYSWMFCRNESIAQDEEKIVYRKHPDGTPCYAKDPKDCPVIRQHMKADEADDLNDTGVDDAAYMEAVKNGDMETCAKMVREAAEKAMPRSKIRDENGNLKALYHCSDKSFSVPEVPWEGPIEWEGLPGFFLADSPQSQYGSTTMRLFVNLRNPLDMNAGGGDYLHGRNSRQIEKFSEAYENAISNHPDDFKFSDDGLLSITQKGLDSLEFDGYYGLHSGNATEYAVMSPTQVKSADPITYDDDGNVIPLGKRFDFTNPDIRY